MRLKFTFCVALLFLGLNASLAQDQNSILKAPKDWQPESFNFPLTFAPEIDFEGFEDIRFAPNWDNPEDANFWSYTFVWYIEMIGMSSGEKLEELMTLYYKGLMKSVLEQNEETDLLEKAEEVVASFNEVEEGVFQGTVEVFDAFHTKKKQTFYIKVSEFFCPDTEKQLMRFDISLLYFGAPIWEELNKVEVTVKNCEK